MPAPIEYPEYSQAEILAQCHTMLVNLTDRVDALAAKVERLEQEFAPLARKYSRLTSAAASLPGVGLGRRAANAGAPGSASGRPRR